MPVTSCSMVWKSGLIVATPVRVVDSGYLMSSPMRPELPAPPVNKVYGRKIGRGAKNGGWMPVNSWMYAASLLLPSGGRYGQFSRDVSRASFRDRFRPNAVAPFG